MLNAFRHHGIGHVYRHVDGAAGDECSTPSGIMESVTSVYSFEGTQMSCAQRLPASWNRSLCRTSPEQQEGISAQRLPASWNRSQRNYEMAEELKVCSTPSGIMESVTSTPGGIVFSVAGCSTPSGIMESVTLRKGASGRGAGVLNAFRHHGIGHILLRLSMPPPPCAQRLPASWNRSQRPSGDVARLQAVLNAFRHHGIGHRLLSIQEGRLR